MAAKPEKAASHAAGKAGEEIRFAMGPSSLGLILVASSAKGVVSILFGEDEELLIDDLQSRFPGARFARGDRKDDKQRLKRVLDCAETPSLGLDLPLEVRGTEFQQNVWRVIREIAIGETSTYTEIALKVGAPRAMRAVGNACSTNKLALAIPCHRVLLNDGRLSGGNQRDNARQRALLDREGVTVTGSPSGSAFRR
jgi:AraC family transcriptional regulator, regulatory protein of adaptative response / methylated-DNA-[protein]-cysteine methyltransferase